MRLSILIVNYNTELYISKLIEDLNQQSLPAQDYEIIIVNNVQNEKMNQVVHENFNHTKLQIKVIASPLNIGFGRAMNLAAQHAIGQHLLIANPDLQMLQEDYLSTLLQYADQNQDYGIISTQLLNDNHQDTSEYYYYEFKNNLGYTQQINWFCGAVMLIRPQVFQQLNGFDPDFFMYCEDEDLCLRVKQLGLPLVKLNELKIYHKGGSSEPLKDVAFYQRWFKSQLLFAYKHYSQQDFQNITTQLEKKAKQKVTLYRYILFLKSKKNQQSYHKWLAIQDSIQQMKQDIEWLYFKI